MNILIDLQGAQSASRFRGIGRFSLAFSKAIVRNRGEHSIKLLLNGLYVDSLDELRRAFNNEVSDDGVVVFDAEGPVAESEKSNIPRARIAEMERERLIKYIDPDVIIVTSLFEGFDDDGVTSVGLLGGDGPLVVVILHDLIPYFNSDPDWPAHYNSFYDLKIESFRRADLLLSVSSYSKEECIGEFPEFTNRVVEIGAACDDAFSRSDSLSSERLGELGVTRSFVMSLGCLEPRKNLAQLVRAFAAMPIELRMNRQVVLVGESDQGRVEVIQRMAAEAGLGADQLQVLRRVCDEDLILLYRTCEIFVFPSLSEGFGLPLLEAMSCGAVVLGARSTSIPEVIGRDDALFDPMSVSELRDLMIRVLVDHDFRHSLRAHAAKRSAEFSWDRTAQRAIQAIEAGVERKRADSVFFHPKVGGGMGKPRLAMVSPLPPEQTGIADFVVELLPLLGETYDITVISDRANVHSEAAGDTFPICTVAWFEENAQFFDRVVYQVGNSPFHAHMLDLIRRIPGIVVLHDFFISDLMQWMDESGYGAGTMRGVLERSHGLGALELLSREGIEQAKLLLPCNYDVISNALGVMVHSHYCRDMLQRFYGDKIAQKICLLRHHRAKALPVPRLDARRRLGFCDDDFVVCSFGFIGGLKLNDVLLSAWRLSSLAKDPKCKLVFVGGKGGGDYVRRLDEMIASLGEGAHVSITGYVSRETYIDYLSQADVAVQLRTSSRGETSGAVLDCMAHGVPLVISANGPMNEYPDEILIKLDDGAGVADVVDALERLRGDDRLRTELTERGREYVESEHALHLAAAEYVAFIEKTVDSALFRQAKQVTMDFWKKIPSSSSEFHSNIARKVTDLIFDTGRRYLYLDVSATARNDLKTGIERATRSLLRELLLSPPAGFHVVPVVLCEEHGRWRVRRAHSYLASQDGFGLVDPYDEIVVPAEGDILFSLDLFPKGVILAAKQGLYRYWRESGATVGFMVHDLLPISRPEFFPPRASETHQAWMAAICENSNLLVCISEHVKRATDKWWRDFAGKPNFRMPRLATSGHGSDILASLPTAGLPPGAHATLACLRERPTFLMVGTIEPRKGYLQVLSGFERLWRRGIDVNLVIVGSEGWKALAEEERRTIPETMRNINKCSELGRRFLWLESITDEYLERIYEASTCLLAASEGEGYGLPLIEAARHQLPIIARDIDVFREVAGAAAFYFEGIAPDDIEQTIVKWLKLRAEGQVPDAANLGWETWAQSARRLGRVVTAGVACEGAQRITT